MNKQKKGELKMEFEITETLYFDIDCIANNIAYGGESFITALDIALAYDNYFRLEKYQQKALKIAIFERCITKLKEQEEP